MNKHNSLSGAALVALGVGAGSYIVPEAEVTMVSPEPVEIIVEKVVEKEIRFESLTDKADKSIRDSMGLSDAATNADVVAALKASQDEVDRLTELNQTAANTIRQLSTPKRQPSAVQTYQRYKGGN